jgi:hypothetical protein
MLPHSSTNCNGIRWFLCSSLQAVLVTALGVLGDDDDDWF